MKYLLYALAGLVALAVVAAVAALVLVDPNRYRDDIAALVEEKTGRKLTIEGDLHLSVFPWLGVRTGRLVLANAPGFGDGPLLRVEGAEIRVKLLPLLRKQVAVDRIVLDSPALHLVRNARGRGNWEIAGGGPPSRPESETARAPRQPLPPLVVGGLTVKDGELLWEDRQSGKTLRLSHVNVDLGSFAFDRPTDLALGFVLTLPEAGIKETLALETRLVVSADLQRFALRALEVRSHTEGDKVPGGQLRAGLNVDTITADLAQQTLGVENLRLTAAKARLQGNLEGSTIVDAPRFQGSFKLEAPLKETLTALGVAFSPADPEALERLQLDFGLRADSRNLAVEPLRLRLDDTTLQGWIKVADLADPAVRFDLQADALDADRYLPKPVSSSSSPSPAAETGAEQPLPLAALAGQRLNGELRLGRLTVHRLKLHDLRLRVAGDRRRLTLTPTLGLYQGRYRGQVRIDARGGTPALTLRSSLERTAIGPLLQDYLAKPPPLTGTTDLDLTLQARGRTATALKRSLDGNVVLRVMDGHLANVPLLELIEQGLAWWQARGQAVAVPEKRRQLDFVSLDFAARVDDGVMRTERLLIDNPKLKITGDGIVDLVHERVDYRIRALHTSGNRKPGSRLGRIARDLPVIVRIDGPLTKPRYRLDLVQMAQEKFQEKIQKQKAVLERKLGRKLEKELGPGAGQLLKGLFGP